MVFKDVKNKIFLEIRNKKFGRLLQQRQQQFLWHFVRLTQRGVKHFAQRLEKATDKRVATMDGNCNCNSNSNGNNNCHGNNSGQSWEANRSCLGRDSDSDSNSNSLSLIGIRSSAPCLRPTNCGRH